MSRRSEERTGEEDWRAAAESGAQQPRPRSGKLIILIVVIVSCAAAYAVWRLVQAIVDPESRRRDAKRLGQRVGYAVSVHRRPPE